MSNSLTGITDAVSADKMLPDLRALGGKLDDLKTQMAGLPAEGRARLVSQIKDQYGKLESQVARNLWIPGVGDKIKSAWMRCLARWPRSRACRRRSFRT